MLSIWHRPGSEAANMGEKKLRIYLGNSDILIFDESGNLVEGD